MREADINRIVFYSKEDGASYSQLKKGESILKNITKSEYNDVNEILELYNIKKYIDNEFYLNNWTEEDILEFKQKTIEYAKAIGRFMSNVNDDNVIDLFQEILRDYVDSFLELINNQNGFKRISKKNFSDILSNEPHLVNYILTHKNIVEHYSVELKNFLLNYSQSAEILLSIYEVKEDHRKLQKFIPKNLTIEDKDNIISNYLDSSNVNYNYIELIQNARNRNDFKIKDKTRLKAKRLHQSETEKLLKEKGGMKYGVNISFSENTIKLKEEFINDNFIANYIYSLDYIRENNNMYLLFQNFKILFEYLDNQNRIKLVNKKSQMGVFERFLGVRSQNEYIIGTTFNLQEMTSYVQIVAYDKVIRNLKNSLENILHHVFTSSFQEKYDFAVNARFLIPSATSCFEKVRFLAPEFESVLKQFKLFVEEGFVDFELLQISSLPSSIKDIPSLNKKKYIYFNEDNKEMVACSNLFFSDQTLLTYVEPFKEKSYRNFFNLLTKEQVIFSNYEEHQKPQLNYLINKGFISLDNNDFLQINNPKRLMILKDLYNNEVASLYSYPIDFRQEAQQMESENIVFFESSLFSKPEQAYFSYFLNKSDFTNGLDLRNSYLHGTQANPDEIQKHEYAYFTYLKLLFLTLLKIEDDLAISKVSEA